MASRKRDYKAEYRRRIARALARGLSKTQARGHRHANEAPANWSGRQRAVEDARLQVALKSLRKSKAFTRAAKDAGISIERLRSYAVENGIVEKRGRRWVVKQDLPRRLLIYTGALLKVIVVSSFKQASVVGKYMSAVRWFLRSNDAAHLKPFEGRFVTDINGKRYPLETRPRVLYRLSHSGGPSFEQIYRIVV